MSATASAIALVDCVSFYVSCERVFDARLVRRPIVVLSLSIACLSPANNVYDVSVTTLWLTSYHHYLERFRHVLRVQAR